jgi:hypothetical protein
VILSNAGVMAALMAAFVAANHPDASGDASERGLDRLVQETKDSFELLTPYSMAAGRGSPSAWLSGESTQAGDIAAHASGNERLSATNAMHGSLMHPGEMAAAAAAVRDVQRRMLAEGLPAGAAADSVRVAVTVHPTLEPFIYSQPRVFQSGVCWQQQL